MPGQNEDVLEFPEEDNSEQRFRVAPKLIKDVMGTEKMKPLLDKMFPPETVEDAEKQIRESLDRLRNTDGNNFFTVGPKAEEFEMANQKAAIETLRLLITCLEQRPNLRLGQALISSGLAKDDNEIWNASSQSLLAKVKRYLVW